MNQPKVFFSGLNELRAIAAFSVLFYHVELNNRRLKTTSLFDFPLLEDFISNLGNAGVGLFFVLSGFLITYLLLEEKSAAGDISIAQFYKRRILRIWPLYFIVIGIAFFLLPMLYKSFPLFFEGQSYFILKIEKLHYGTNLLLYLFFLSNVAVKIFSPVAGAAQTWSVSVEEQFYLIWPWVIKLFSRVLIPVLVLIIICVGIGSYYANWFSNPAIRAFVQTFNIDFMAVGGLCAVLYRKHKAAFSRLGNDRWFFATVIASVVIQLFVEVYPITLSASFALLIVCVIERQVKSNFLDVLGKWSYGIYMYHTAVMYISFSIVDHMNMNSPVGDRLMQYALVIGLTVGISCLSYRYVELFFLKLKQKFSPVITGNI